MKKNFTVLGSSGFIGRRLANSLVNLGLNVWLPKRQAPEIFDRPLGVVFYCIGLTADFNLRPFDTVEAHVSYLARVLEMANYEHLIYLSSTRLYDDIPINLAGVNVALSLNPSNPRHLYDLSKALGENLCLKYASSTSGVARLSNVYDTAPDAPGFLSELLQRLRYEQSITLNSSPCFHRDYIALDDAVESLIRIGEEKACGIINVACGINTVNQEIANMVRPLGIDIHFKKNGASRDLPICDVDSLHKLGIYPRNTLCFIESFVRNLPR